MHSHRRAVGGFNIYMFYPANNLASKTEHEAGIHPGWFSGTNPDTS